MKNTGAKQNGEQSFNVYTYSIQNENEKEYCHWSKGLKMIIKKDGISMELNSDELQMLVKSLPRTMGGRY